jgi:hypothetical protein
MNHEHGGTPMWLDILGILFLLWVLFHTAEISTFLLRIIS